MAARLHPTPPQDIVDLRRISSRDLNYLLEEETASWKADLEWDFGKSADLVRRFVDLRALNGSALLEGGEVAGYVYYVLEENKGLIGDLYVRSDLRTVERENRLLAAALEPVMANRHIDRVECQLMMVSQEANRWVPQPQFLSAFERNFMRIDLRCAPLGEGRIRCPIFVEKWSDHYQDAAGELIAAAYTGHIDSRINDQYRSAAGSRRFLYNIVQYPGCGMFYRPASYAAFDARTGRLCGISLASLVAPECGHITQICVTPAVRGTGVGHELLRRSLTTLRDAQCCFASLTVTASNVAAVALYERMGFVTARRFAAYVWDGFRQ